VRFYRLLFVFCLVGGKIGFVGPCVKVDFVGGNRYCLVAPSWPVLG